MDYDDYDFQNQNFQLVGEDNNRFPQNLPSFTLPKFDIDDHLQVHLRFDSLAETEVLLGIQSQENTWIEEFSSINSTIDFGSSAAESCSISRHNNVWSEATSSESVEMLLKSVKEDEEANQQVISKEAVADAIEDSSNFRMEDAIHSGPTFPPDEFHGNLLGSEKAVVKEEQQIRSTSQISEDKKWETIVDVGLTEEKLHSCGKSVAEECIVDIKLASSSDNGTKECLVDDELLEVIQGDDSLDIVSRKNSSPDDNDCAVKDCSIVSPKSLSCMSTKCGPSSVSVDTVDIGAGKLSVQLFSDQITEDCHKVDMSEKQEVLHPDDKQNMMGHIQCLDGKLNDKRVEVHDFNNDACKTENLKDSFYLDSSQDSLMLLNRSSCSVFSQNSDGLLETFAYPVNVLNNESLQGDKILIGTEETSVAMQMDVVTEKNSVKIVNLAISNQSHGTEGSKYSSHVVHRLILKDDCLHLSPQSTNKEKTDDFAEERELAASKPALADGQEPKIHLSDQSCSEMRSSSGSVVKVQNLTLMNNETVITEVNDGVDCRINALGSNNSENAVMRKSVENDVKGITEESTAKSDTSKCARLEESSPALSDEAKIKISSFAENKLNQMSDLDTVLPESLEDNIIQHEASSEKQFTSQAVDICRKTSKNFSVNKEIASYKVQTSGYVTDGSLSNKSIQEKTVAGHVTKSVCSPSPHSSTVLQQSNSDVMLTVDVVIEKREAAVSPLPASGCKEKDLNISSSSVINSFLDTAESSQPIAAPDVADGSSSAKICQDPSGDMLNVYINNPPTSDLGSDVESQSLDPECGKPLSPESNCASPTVISCNEHSQDKVRYQESDRGLIDPSVPGYDTTSNIDKGKSTVHDSKDNTASEDDGSFKFEVQSIVDIPHKETCGDWKTFSSLHFFPLPQTSKENSEGCESETKDGNMCDNTIRTSEEDKRKQASEQVTRKGSISKGDVKEKPQQKQAKGKERSPCRKSPFSDKTRKNKTQAEALFHQPFTDLQQVQLRAQIFVYGSLIQGVPPDEACMLSAFEGTDGGRSLWEGAWRSALESFQNRNPPLHNFDTPLHSSSGALATDQGSSYSAFQIKPLNSLADRSGSMFVSSATMSPTVSHTSPLWAISSHDGLPSNIPRGNCLEFNQFLTPSHPYQSSQIKQYASNSTPWLPQSHNPSSWGFSTQSSIVDSSSLYSTIPVAETAKLTPARDSSLSHVSNVQLASPLSLLPNQGDSSVSTTLVAPVEMPKKTPAIVRTKKDSTSQKSRKRTKISPPEGLQPGVPISPPLVESATAAVLSKHVPSSAGLSFSVISPSKFTYTGLVPSTSHLTSPNYFQIIGRGDVQQRVVFSEETRTQIEQSKLQAEAASAHAAAAVRLCQSIWSQLASKRTSGLVLEVENKLASAAVAAAAAASVSKAAAEAAKVASESALQAKMMVDEALNSINSGNPAQNSEITLDLENSLARLTPVSILKGKDKIHGSTSIISAAQEVARKRVESASAMAKQAENLDAIVKAAELAAEAVSQAGTIISMGDPLPFSISELVEAGPDGYWKIHHERIGDASEKNDVLVDENLGIDASRDHHLSPSQSSERPSSLKEGQVTDVEGMASNNKWSTQSEENYGGSKLENASKATGTPARDPAINNLQGSSIQKGSLVEVAGNEDGLRGAWFSASVLDVKDGKANVCYNDLHYDEGHGQLKEWIPLDCDGEKAPRIRIAHPLTQGNSEGTRKRRREAVENYSWAVGDRVDAWICEGWREGIVTEKFLEDEKKFTIHFPAAGDTSVVRAWNLRPSLIWKDGQWIEWSNMRERSILEPYEGDTLHEKCQMIGHFEAKNNSYIDMLKINHTDDSRKLEESRPLNLSAKDEIFSVGKGVRDDNNSNDLKVKRTGLQKEGSKVVFGIPKPGKKRKFMEVSKHFTAEKTDKVSEGSYSLKFTKYLMPQASRALRNISKDDGKGKKSTNSKPRGLEPSGSQNIQARSTQEKVNSSITAVPALNGGEHGLRSSPNLGNSFTNEESHLEKKNFVEVGTFTNVLGKSGLSVIESSVQSVPGVQSSKKSSGTVDAETGEKGKALPGADKSNKFEVKLSENAERTSAVVIEPRRSNRKTQPTSRLLEGLQSSLIISKIPNFSHDKGAKTSHRSEVSSRGHNRG